MSEGDSGLKFEFEGKTYDIEDFELGELEWIEDELGTSLDQVNWTSIKALTRFVTVVKRRDNPTFTLDDARKLTLRVFEEPANANGAAERPTRRAKSTGSGATAKS